jgi:hypothetical protein
MLVIWLLVPVGAMAFHMGPGQDHLRLNKVSRLIEDADKSAVAEDWEQAQYKYEAALDSIPEENKDLQRSVRLQRAKMQIMNKQLPTAHADLKSLVESLKADENADPAVTTEAQAALANARYYITWLMRVEGKPDEKWQKEISAAEQTYRLLARRAEQDGDETALVRYQEDLESTIRLARMDLGELQGIPLPSQ